MGALFKFFFFKNICQLSVQMRSEEKTENGDKKKLRKRNTPRCKGLNQND